MGSASRCRRPHPGRRRWLPCQPWMQHPPALPRWSSRRRGRPGARAGAPTGHGRAHAGRRRAAVRPAPAGHGRADSEPRSGDPEGPPFSRRHGAGHRRRRGGGPGGRPGAAVLDPFGPLARRGPDRQHRPAARSTSSPRSSAGTAPRRCTTSCSTSGWAGSAPRTWPCGRCPGSSAWPPSPWPGWPAGGWAGGPAGWAAMLLVATSPFAIRYDTETRMYSLVVLLTVLGFLALDRCAPAPAAGQPDRRRRGDRAAALHPLLVALPDRHGHAVAGLGGLAGTAGVAARAPGPRWWPRSVGCLTFLPWVPTFLFQSHHTGTPWATPANFAAMVNAVASFAGGGTSQGRALALIFFALAGLGLFGVATDRRHIDLDIRTRPLGRPLAVVGGRHPGRRHRRRARHQQRLRRPLRVGGVHPADPAGGPRADHLPRPAGAGRPSWPWPWSPGWPASIPNVTTNRTQAGQVAAAIAAYGQAGGRRGLLPGPAGPGGEPAPSRGPLPADHLPPGHRSRLRQLGRLRRGRRRRPRRSAFAEHLESLAAAAGRQIFLVWARRVPGVRAQVRGHRPDPAGRTPTTGPQQLVAGNADHVLSAHVAGAFHTDQALSRRRDRTRIRHGRRGPRRSRSTTEPDRRPSDRPVGRSAATAGSGGRWWRSCRPGSWPGSWWRLSLVAGPPDGGHGAAGQRRAPGCGSTRACWPGTAGGTSRSPPTATRPPGCNRSASSRRSRWPAGCSAGCPGVGVGRGPGGHRQPVRRWRPWPPCWSWCATTSGDGGLARRSVWLLALAPAAYSLVLGYADAAAAPVLGGGLPRRPGPDGGGGRRRPAWPPGLVRPVGILLVVPVVIEVWRQPAGRRPAPDPVGGAGWPRAAGARWSATGGLPGLGRLASSATPGCRSGSSSRTAPGRGHRCRFGAMWHNLDVGGPRPPPGQRPPHPLGGAVRGPAGGGLPAAAPLLCRLRRRRAGRVAGQLQPRLVRALRARGLPPGGGGLDPDLPARGGAGRPGRRRRPAMAGYAILGLPRRGGAR